MRYQTTKSIFSFCLWMIISTLVFPLKNLDPVLWKRAQEIHRNAIVIDTHVDTPMMMARGILDIGQRSEQSDVDLIKMEEGGVDGVFFAVYLSNQEIPTDGTARALETIDVITNQVGKYTGTAEMAFTVDDVRANHIAGRKSIFMGMENGAPINKSLRLLRIFFRLGIRYITLCHNKHNEICDSSSPEQPRWNGLSPFGKEVVHEMNKLGIIIDVSHISDESFWDVLKTSRTPVMASHSAVRTICNSSRNLSDDMIKGLAAKGGVVQLVFYSAFLDESFRQKTNEVRKQLKPQTDALREKYPEDRMAYWKEVSKLWEKYGPPQPKIDKLIEHIDHIVQLVGIDYVGLGSDYDGAGSFPEGLENMSGYPLITYHLLKKGYSEKDIKKILGENFLRVFEAVEKEASNEKP